MKQKTAFSQDENEQSAVREICAQLGSSQVYDAILFFASSKYNFALLSKLFFKHFSNCQVLGTTTSGEISFRQGFSNKSIVAVALSCPTSAVKGKAFERAEGVLFLHKRAIEQLIRECAISKNADDAFAVVFSCALSNTEENVSAILKNALGNDFPVIGGNAGDDLRFKQTFVSCNGEVVSQGFALLLFKTNDKFAIIQKNLFLPASFFQQKSFIVSETDSLSRTILAIDNQPPLSRLAQITQQTESQLKRSIQNHVIGRIAGNETFASAIQSFNSNKSITLRSRVLKNSRLIPLQIGDPLQIIEKTATDVLRLIEKPSLTFLCCDVLLSLLLKQKNLESRAAEFFGNAYAKTYSGFFSYGQRANSSYTEASLVILAVE